MNSANEVELRAWALGIDSRLARYWTTLTEAGKSFEETTEILKPLIDYFKKLKHDLDEPTLESLPEGTTKSLLPKPRVRSRMLPLGI